MSAPAHPLRPYYVAPPASDWSFGGPSPSAAPTSSTSSSSRSFQPPPSLRSTPRNRYESTTEYATVGGLGAVSQLSAGAMARSFVASSFQGFLSTALIMPFEVGKTLAQVQWVPRDGIDPMTWGGNQDVVEEEVVELDDEAEAEAYFSDLQARGQTSFAPPTDAPLRPVSPSGYLMRSGISDVGLGTKPEWIMPVVVQGGVWEMMKTVGKWKGEGWSSLWKGQTAAWLWEGGMATIPPLLQSFLTLIFFPTSSPSLFTSLPLIHSPHPLPLLAISTLAQAITYVILSPLDLIRTRMIVQSAQVAHRKYSTPWSALSTIIAEEGGLQTTYFHSSLLIPTILEGVIRPFIYMSIPLIISRWLLLEPSSSPLFFLLAEFVLNSAGLLITIPIETVRKRLQIQSRAAFVRGGRVGGTGRAWRTCVETRPQPYLGVVECVYRILTEETGNIPRRRRRSAAEREGSTKGKGKAEKEDLGTAGLGVGNGLRQLYRGLGMGVGANLCVFLLTLLGGGESSVGWAEV